MSPGIFDEIRKLQEGITREFMDFDRKFDRFFRGNDLLNIKSNEPITRISSKGSNLIISLDMPGMDKKDIYVKATKDNIEIRAIKKEHVKIGKKGFFKEERSIKSFYKMISLPEEVIANEIKTKYTGNVLVIIAPKAKEKRLKKARKILVSS